MKDNLQGHFPSRTPWAEKLNVLRTARFRGQPQSAADSEARTFQERVPSMASSWTACSQQKFQESDWTRLRTVRGHGQTAVVVADWTRLRPVGRTLRDVFQPLREHCVGNRVDDSPDAAWSANWTPTWMLRARQANCHADFSDNCPVASWLLRQPLRGHSPALRGIVTRQLLGLSAAVAGLMPG